MMNIVLSAKKSKTVSGSDIKVHTKKKKRNKKKLHQRGSITVIFLRGVVISELDLTSQKKKQRKDPFQGSRT